MLPTANHGARLIRWEHTIPAGERAKHTVPNCGGAKELCVWSRLGCYSVISSHVFQQLYWDKLGIPPQLKQAEGVFCIGIAPGVLISASLTSADTPCKHTVSKSWLSTETPCPETCMLSGQTKGCGQTTVLLIQAGALLSDTSNKEAQRDQQQCCSSQAILPALSQLLPTALHRCQPSAALGSTQGPCTASLHRACSRAKPTVFVNNRLPERVWLFQQ